MNEIIVKENIKIENMIYEIRGKQAMLDSDLAFLFEYETKELNRNVKNNIEKFPENYCFQLTNGEFEKWKSQIVMSNSDKIGLRKKPYVFTEQA